MLRDALMTCWMASTVKRVKKSIEVVIPVLADDSYELIHEAAANAYEYADHVFFCMAETRTPPGPLQASLMKRYGAHLLANGYPYDSPFFRGQLNRQIRTEGAGYEPRVIFYAEIGWRVSRTDLVRDAVEFHDSQILTAMRYFQWEKNQFRIDGEYRPARLPMFGSYLSDAHWTDPLQAAPSWMWSARTRWVEAPFFINDTLFTYPGYKPRDPRTPTLTPITLFE